MPAEADYSYTNAVGLGLPSFSDNERAQWAYRFISGTYRNIFLTGKAGTGKTTLLKALKESLSKRMIVVAPTGVAAINAGGVTIHSLFQLPFTPFVPGSTYTASVDGKDKVYTKRFSREKIWLIRSIDLLVIDEISMVRADVLDAVDDVLRRFRNKELPFGGVQLLMIGDLRQLPPVVQENEWEILSSVYKSPFFYESATLKQAGFITIELEHIYRQQDSKFISVLNNIREGNIDSATLITLNDRLRPGFVSDDYILLTTHNRNAQNINDTRLRALSGSSRIFKAVTEGDFPEYNFPTEELLELKTGARVMFLRNDNTEERLFFNGKIGTVTGFGEGCVYVLGDGDNVPVKIEHHEWHNTKYELDQSSGQITETITGSFKQYPLRLAWAITIHKSQGLTFDKVIVDAGRSFAHGQVYVALSRCRSLEGLVLRTPVSPGAVIGDEGVVNFITTSRNYTPGWAEYRDARVEYLSMLVLELFDFTSVAYPLWGLAKRVRENYSVVFGSLKDGMNSLSTIFDDEVLQISYKFRIQLKQYFDSLNDPENHQGLQDRINKGAVYFLEKISSIFPDSQNNLSYETDNKTVGKSFDEMIQRINQALIIKKACLESCSAGFNIKNYQDARVKSMMAAEGHTLKKEKKNKVRQPKEAVEATDFSEAEPDLVNALRALRQRLASERNCPLYMIFQQKTLLELAVRQPVTLKELAEISGMGNKRIHQFGPAIIEVILSNRKFV